MLGTRRTVISDDGTKINYQSLGYGPGIIVVPGALATIENLNKLSQELAQYFTVHTIERRGRGLSGPQGMDYNLNKECQDIRAVQSNTDAEYLFGHSFGGFAALEAARNNKRLRKIVVYEPGVSIDGSINISWTSRCEKELKEMKYQDAFTTFVQGTNPQSAKLPHWLLKWILLIAIKKEEREQSYRLLETAIREHSEEARLNNTYKNYSEIEAPVLLLRGGKGVMPTNTELKLMTVLPKGSQAEILPDFDHFGPENRAKEVAQKVNSFFRQPESIAQLQTLSNYA
jgi:pimeloyl-ACP methyl ester carboxylesterase